MPHKPKSCAWKATLTRGSRDPDVSWRGTLVCPKRAFLPIEFNIHLVSYGLFSQ